MIRSMTGYGTAHFEVQGVGFELEVRSVNHRYLDLRVRLPRALSALEAEVRARVQARLARGKVDLVVGVSATGSGLSELALDLAVAGRYVEAAARLREAHGVGGELDVATLLGMPGVAQFVDRPLPEDALREALRSAVDRALEALLAMRDAEGRALDADLRARLDRVAACGDRAEERSQAVVTSVKEKLRRRTEQLRDETGLLDEARLHQEVVIAADRLDVSEEIVRLRSHVDQFRRILDGAGGDAPPGESGVGRRLDFLLQEMGREANTLGSKGGDSEIAHRVVELKAELERIREQVQNVE